MRTTAEIRVDMSVARRKMMCAANRSDGPGYDRAEFELKTLEWEYEVVRRREDVLDPFLDGDRRAP